MKILLVDDEDQSREALGDFLSEQLNYQVVQSHNGQQALEFLQNDSFHVVISDIKMPKLSGIELLKKIKSLEHYKRTNVILMTGYGDIQSAIEALRAGAYDYLLKPIEVEELAAIMGRIEEHQHLLQENMKLNEKTNSLKNELNQYKSAYGYMFGNKKIIANSADMQKALNTANKLHEDENMPVLIDGETGTGKEVIARAVHFGPESSTRPFIPLNCSSITPTLFESELFGYTAGAFTGADRKGKPGKIELARGGTLFLDEIGDMPLELQPKLLRVLQEKEIYRIGGVNSIKIDFRFVGATNKNLLDLVKQGKFREDLYFRLNVARITIPPLRERIVDILPLAQMFMEHNSQYKKRNFKKISKSAASLLENYSWPGNVRELKNTIERVILLHDNVEIKPEYLDFLENKYNMQFSSTPSLFQAGSLILPDDKLDVENLEKEITQKVFQKFNGNKTKMAQYMGITRSALRSWLKKIEK